MTQLGDIGEATKEEVDTVNEGTSELEEARKEYEVLAGKRPFHGWNVGILRDKINELALA